MLFFQNYTTYLALVFLASSLAGCKCSAVSLGCADYEMDTPYTATPIFTGPGTEDMALDTSQGYPRLIVSCDERRGKRPPSGSFYAINLQTRDTLRLAFDQDPSTLFPNDEKLSDWHPHGIALARLGGTDYLYSVTHRGKKRGQGYRSDEILRFRIGADTLFYDTLYRDKALKTPNDIFVLSDGSFYVSNILKKSSMWQFIRGAFGAKTGNIVYYHPENGWKAPLSKQAYPNGIFVDEAAQHLYMMHGACQEANRYTLSAPGQIAPGSKTTAPQKIAMGDNLTRDSQGYLWATSHPCLFKFLKHSKGKGPAPSLAYRIDPQTMEAELVYQNNGEEISAASTALWHDGKLYLSQVFDNFVLEIDWTP
ncbi:MAG: SMP-30/gluconolactonase/LRE family protein [Phaeodactylibacter sp.]|nr:SMP-30/gluconolactonase/LRE family protein [Phaeodactylibacter sp.]MCB9049819.1 SMP-30/gluconolactonase/LRE family protein [Lewinellaceae bacterium]